MDREAWRAVIHGVTKSRTQLSDQTELTEFWLITGLHLFFFPQREEAQGENVLSCKLHNVFKKRKKQLFPK